MGNTEQKYTREQLEDMKLRLMVFQSAYELGKKVDDHLLDMYGFPKDKYTFMVPIKENFFEDGHLKVEIGETVRGKDNYSICTFETGKVYNCGLNASYNIGARYFIRELLKPLPAKVRSRIRAKVPGIERRTSNTLSTLKTLVKELAA